MRRSVRLVRLPSGRHLQADSAPRHRVSHRFGLFPGDAGIAGALPGRAGATHSGDAKIRRGHRSDGAAAIAALRPGREICRQLGRRISRAVGGHRRPQRQQQPRKTDREISSGARARAGADRWLAPPRHPGPGPVATRGLPGRGLDQGARPTRKSDWTLSTPST